MREALVRSLQEKLTHDVDNVREQPERATMCTLSIIFGGADVAAASPLSALIIDHRASS
jgi:hypothetical protein